MCQEVTRSSLFLSPQLFHLAKRDFLVGDSPSPPPEETSSACSPAYDALARADPALKPPLPPQPSPGANCNAQPC